jgi:cephalosporin hydroxylase
MVYQGAPPATHSVGSVVSIFGKRVCLISFIKKGNYNYMSTNTDNDRFIEEVKRNIQGLRTDRKVRAHSIKWLRETLKHKYSYNFSWLSRPIIQYPQDMVAVQELIWRTRPDIIVETGIAHGGSLILSASMIAMLDYCDAVKKGKTFDPRASQRRVLGIDIDIRAHNREAIEAHPLSHMIEMIQGSSIAPDIVEQVYARADKMKSVAVFLDSNHTHEHVLAELEAYAPLVSIGSYCVVFDTIIEYMPDDTYQDRPWDKGNNPMTAIRQYLKTLLKEGRKARDGGRLTFEVDTTVEDKLLITAAPGGYLRRIS